MKILLIIVLYSFSVSTVFALEDVDIERVLENLNRDARNLVQLDDIEYLAEHPISIEPEHQSQIASLPGFTPLLAEEIIREASHAASIEDICKLLSLGTDQCFILNLCTRLDTPNRHAKSDLSIRSRWTPELNSTKGIENNTYVGNGLDCSNRLRASAYGFGLNLLTNKNSGEAHAAEQISGNVCFGSEDFFAIAGDYITEAGMGAILSKPFASSAGIDPVSPVSRYSFASKPYIGSYDLGFFRGVTTGAIIRFGKGISVRLMGFMSSKLLPGTLDSLTGDVVSVYSAGYYRTASEVDKKWKFRELAVGAASELNIGGFALSVQILRLDYSLAIRSESKAVFEGKGGTLGSIAGSGIIGSRYAYSAEIAFDGKSNCSATSGIEANLGKIRLGVAARYFPGAFRSPYGSSFGNSETPANESGLYAGAVWKASTQDIIGLRIDAYRTPDTAFRKHLRSDGIEVVTDYTRQLDANSDLYMKARISDRSCEASDSSNAYQYRERAIAFRFEYSKAVTKRFSASVRFDYAGISYSGEKPSLGGSAGSVRIQSEPTDWLTLRARAAVYSTDGYDAAIWLFDGTLPGMLRTVALYGSGIYWTVDARIAICTKANLSIKYFENNKHNTETIGTGNEQILGNVDRGLVLQMDLKL